MQSIISERAKIREMDAEAILSRANELNIQYEGMPFMGFVHIDITTEWIELEKNYKQLTGLSMPYDTLGICQECKSKPAMTNYSNMKVCHSCSTSLNNYFDEEYS